MKVLLVEDREEKAAQISLLLRSNGVDADDLVVVNTVFSAREQLMRASFDLLILDVVIPLRRGEDAYARHGIELLREVSDISGLNPPKYIVGLSEVSDAVSAYRADFEDLTWDLIEFDRSSDEWANRLLALIHHISNLARDAVIARHITDVVIVTALRDPEHAALLALPWAWGPPRPIDHHIFYREGTAISQGRSLRVAVAHASRMGLVHMSMLTTKVISHLKPRVLIMCGICAGVRGKTNIGDIVVADKSWDWQSGKYVVEDGSSKFQYDPDYIPASGELLAIAQLMTGNQYEGYLNRHGIVRSREPAVLFAPMASGAAVLADESVVATIKRQNRKTLAIDMECYAMYCAANQTTPLRPLFLCVKSVSDHGDEFKSDDEQKSCATLSAYFVAAMIEEHGTGLVDIPH